MNIQNVAGRMFLLSLFCGVSLAGAPAADLMKEANALAGANRKTEAADAYRRIISESGDAKKRLAAENALANLLFQLGRIDEVIAMSERMAGACLDDHHMRGQILNRLVAAYNQRTPADKEAADAVSRRMLNDTSLPWMWRVNAASALGGRLLPWNNPDAAGAVAIYEKLLGEKNIPPNDAARLLDMEYAAWKKVNDFAKMRACAERGAAMTKLPLGRRINFIALSANAFLENCEGKKAQARMREALQLPGINANDRLLVFDKILQLYDNAYDYTTSRAVADSIVTEPRLQGRLNAIKRESRLRQKDYDGALALDRASGDKLREAQTLFYAERYREGVAKAEEVLADGKAADNVRWNAFCRAMENCDRDFDFSTAERLIKTYMPAFAAKNPIRAGYCFHMLRTAMRKGAYEFAVTASGWAVKNPAANARDYFLSRLYRLNALAGVKNAKELVAESAKFAADSRLTPVQQYQLALAGAAFQPGDTDAAIARCDAKFADAKISGAALSDAVIKAGRTAMIGGRYAAAEKIHAKYQALFVPEEKKSATVKFFSGGVPSGVDGWENVTFRAWKFGRNKMERKYGGDMEFLVTDVSTGDRGAVGSGEGGNDRDTDFFVGCDERGVHFFFDGFDDRARDAAAGVVGAGSYEGYLAPGENQPYYCFMVNLQSGKVSLWNSAYDSDFHRMGKLNDNINAEFRYGDKGHKTYLFFDWELFYDKLPENGDVWQFDNIRWGRSGGYSWNGVKTVHGRSSWGELKFACDAAELTKIKHRLLQKAKLRYLREKKTVAAHCGIIDFWKDPEIGDVEFYDACVAPLEKKLDADAALIAPDMTPENINSVYDRAIKPMMNLKSYLENMRRDFLREKIAR